MESLVWPYFFIWLYTIFTYLLTAIHLYPSWYLASTTTHCHLSVSHFPQFLCTTGLSTLFFVSLGLPWRRIQLASPSLSPSNSDSLLLVVNPGNLSNPAEYRVTKESRVRADESRINGPPKLGGRRWGNNPPHKGKHVQNHQQHALGCRTDSTKYSNYISTVSEC